MRPTDDLEAARHEETLPISKLRRTYNAGRNTSESASAIPLRDMESNELRKRLPQLHSSRSVDENAGSSTSTGIDLTPASSEDSGLPQDESRPVFPLTAKIQQICGAMKSRIFSRSNEDDIESPDHMHGYHKIKHEEDPNGFPRGLPRLAALLSADSDMMIFRGFTRARCRILLHKEVEITQLENALDRLDEEDDANPHMFYRLYNTEHSEDWDQRQKELRDQMQTKLKEYDTILLHNAQIQRLGRPPTRDYRSLYNWVYTKQELRPAEYADFVRHESDFVSGVGRTGSGRRSENSSVIGELIRSHLTKNANSPITRFVRIGKGTRKPGEPLLERYSARKLDMINRIIIVSLAAGILLVPVFLLFLVSMTRVQMALVVLAFVLLFGGVMCTTTDATTQEILVAIAAYGAVLVTFLGNFSGNQSCGSMTKTG